MRGPPTVDNPVWEIRERVAEVQALLDDHVSGGKHSAADVVARAAGRPVGIRVAPGATWPVAVASPLLEMVN